MGPGCGRTLGRELSGVGGELAGSIACRKWRDVMVRATGLAAGSLILLTMMVKPGGAAEQQFSCKGQVVQEMTNPGRSTKTNRSERGPWATRISCP